MATWNTSYRMNQAGASQNQTTLVLVPTGYVKLCPVAKWLQLVATGRQTRSRSSNGVMGMPSDATDLGPKPMIPGSRSTGGN